MTISIIKDVLAEEDASVKSIVKKEQDLARNLEEQKIVLEEKAEQRILNAKEKYAEEQEAYAKQLEKDAEAAEKSLVAELRKFDKVTSDKIDSVARKILSVLK